MARTLDSLDTRLLNLIQTEVPLVERPFADLGRSLGVDEGEVLRRIGQLKSPPRPVIRQISAIFDSKALGYQSTLVAGRIDDSRLEQAAAIINRHPGVSHNYRRTHAYNLWYTLAVPPDSRLGLQGTVDVLHRQSGALATRLMPTLKLFKIGVKLDIGGDSDQPPARAPQFTEKDRQQALAFEITEADKRMIRVLQQDLPIVPRPYEQWAIQAGVSVPELLHAAQAYKARSQMRRFSAVLKHREVGFSANAMGVWVVAAPQQDEFGRIAAGFSAVSHCYLRPTYEDWPYNLFTMVHAVSEEACNAVLADISKATGVSEYAALYSTKEFKKTRVQYFEHDNETWEQSVVST